ncbi:hypothetical protein A2291_05130 [candidate division WOR-1 bacterium RIFOXYB2_FULL_42_35]|uniref:Gas vesicle protein n=1 Tax=candidate division WOR-1 bacterium RIFOXYC2_FULL_41_25 TaxID=1802586 RepID=A0A1F4TNI8_UNCSA|nr:MAG: hypothetical protein A2247_00550 [candidate division WOR-1 bacterium RIFOXYA2_FULL_41_14]OGC24483.1 MAG: hypothetical protein A2291_05130 [candidate division WOR-1 bacterium RIFOXYB2_FULL_42_35]OGC34100.1 MAG: hypothetical protein A2462_00990 [candidate division WOR-1 bacterium RIFOXYC2_FULL_41_25]OGC42796.1 MAG: hypothetical protein A2548_00605 [candidate division WOR-1 bacterium RIFOXYD2_FULL_41_8]
MGRFLKNLGLGSLVGFVMGLLFAPQKGEETRKKLKISIDKGKEKFEEIKDEFKKEQEEL